MAKSANIYYQDQLAGLLTEDDRGYWFIYDDEYRKLTAAKPVSLTLPISQKVHHSNTLFAFFDGLIPEGWLLNIAKEHWKVSAIDRFEILLLTCKDTIGAISVIPVNEKN